MIAALPVRRAGGQVALAIAAAALALGFGLPATAAPRQRTVIESFVAATNPCTALRTEVGGQVIGLDELEDVEIRTAAATLVGDAMTVSLDGRLSCRAPAGALLQGDAASDIDATATLSLADCEAADVRVLAQRLRRQPRRHRRGAAPEPRGADRRGGAAAARRRLPRPPRRLTAAASAPTAAH